MSAEENPATPGTSPPEEPAEATTAPRSGSRSIVSLVVRGMLAGTLVTSVVVGVTEVVRARNAGRPSDPPAPSVVPAVPSVTAIATAPLDLHPPPPPPVAVEPEEPDAAAPLASAEPSPPTSAIAPAAPPAAEVPRVAAADAAVPDERQAFERAQRAFSRGDMWTAEAALGDYRRSYPGGAFDVDAKALELELLRARPRKTAELQARAREFLEAHPNAPQARRVRNLLKESGAKLP
jgi:hypothetical protein